MSDQSTLRELLSIIESAVNDDGDQLTAAANPSNQFDTFMRQYMASSSEWSRPESGNQGGSNAPTQGNQSNAASPADRSRRLSTLNFARSARAITDFNQALSQGGSAAIREFERFSRTMGQTSEGLIRHGQTMASAASRTPGGREQLNQANQQVALGRQMQEVMQRAQGRHEASRGSELGHYVSMRGSSGDFNSLLSGIQSTLESAARAQTNAARDQTNAAQNLSGAASQQTDSARRRVNVPDPKAHGWTRVVSHTVDNVLASSITPVMDQLINRPIQTGMMAAETMPGFLPSASLVDQPFRIMTGYLNQMGTDIQTMEMEKKSLLAMTGSPHQAQTMIEHAVEIAKTDPVEFSTALEAFRSFSAFPGTKAEVTSDAGFRSSLLDTIQRMTILAPEQGEGGAMFALRELLTGQESSLKRRFNVDLDTIMEAAGKPGMTKGQFLGMQGGEMIKVLQDGLKKITGQSAMVERSLTTSIQANDIQDTLMQTFALPFTKQGAGVSLMSAQEQAEYEQTLIERNRRTYGASMSDEEIRARSAREAEIAATSRTGAMASGMRGFNDLLGNALEQTGIGDTVSNIIKTNVVDPFLELSKGDTVTRPMDKLIAGIDRVGQGLSSAGKEITGNEDLQRLATSLTNVALTATGQVAPAAAKGMVLGATSMANTLMSPELMTTALRDTLSLAGDQGLVTPSTGIALAGLGYAGSGLIGGMTRRMTGAERFEYDESTRRYTGVDRRGRQVELGGRAQTMAQMFGGDFQKGINLPMLAAGGGLLMGGISGLSQGGGLLESLMGVGSTLAGGATLLSALPDSMREGYQETVVEPGRRQMQAERARTAARQRLGIEPTRGDIWRGRARMAAGFARTQALPIGAAVVGGAVLANEWLDDRRAMQEQQAEREKRVQASTLSAQERARFLQPTGQGMWGSTLSHVGMGAMGLGGALMASGVGLPVGLGVMALGGAASVAGGYLKGQSKEQMERDETTMEMIDSYERQKRESNRVWADLWTEGDTSGLALMMGKPLVEPEARKKEREIDTLTVSEQMALSPEEREAAKGRQVFRGTGADDGWSRSIELERQTKLLQQGGAYQVYREKPGAEGADEFGWTTEREGGWLALGTESMDLRRKMAMGGELTDEEKLTALKDFAFTGQYDKEGAEGFARQQLEKFQMGAADEYDKEWLVKRFDEFDLADKYKEQKGVAIGDITEDMTKGLGAYQEGFRAVLGNKAAAKIADVAGAPGGLQEELLKLAGARTEGGVVTADYDQLKEEFMEKAETAGARLDSSRVDKFTESIHKMSKGLVDASGGTKTMAEATKQVTEATMKASTDMRDQQKAQMIELMPKFAEMDSRRFIPGAERQTGKYFGVDRDTEQIMADSFDLDATKYMSDPTGYFNRLKTVGRNIGEMVQERDQKIVQTGSILGTFRDAGGRFKSDWETEGEFQFRRQSLQAQAQMGRTGAREQLQMEDDLGKYLQEIKDPDELWENIQKFGGAGFTIDPELRKRALSGMMSQGLTRDMKTGTTIMDEYRAKSQEAMGKELGLDQMELSPVKYEDADTALVRLPGRGEGLHRVQLSGINAPEITPEQQEAVARMTGRYQETGDIGRFKEDMAELRDPLAGDLAESLTGGLGEDYVRMKDKLMTPEGLQEFARSDAAKALSMEDKEKLTQLFHHTGLQRKMELEEELDAKPTLKVTGAMDKTGALKGEMIESADVRKQMVEEGWWEGVSDTDHITSALPETILTDRSGRERTGLETEHWRNWQAAIRGGEPAIGPVPEAEDLMSTGRPEAMWSDKGETIQFDKSTGQWTNVKDTQAAEDVSAEKATAEQQVADTTAELNTNMQSLNDTLGLLNEGITEAAGRLAGLG